LSPAAYGIVVSQRSNAAVLGALQVAALASKRPIRRPLILYAAFATGLGIVAAAFTRSFWPLFVAVGVSSPTAGAVWALHRPLLRDAYVPGIRVRVLSLHQSGIVVASVLAPAFVALLTGPLGMSWRAVLLAVGSIAVIAALAALRLRDSPPGAHDTEQ